MSQNVSDKERERRAKWAKTLGLENVRTGRLQAAREALTRSGNRVNPTDYVTTEDRQRGGTTSGNKAVETGAIRKAQIAGGLVQGPIQGQKNVESGQIKTIHSIGGQAWNHIRWHLRRSRVSPLCAYCTGELVLRKAAVSTVLPA